jgi:hypothetical protein
MALDLSMVFKRLRLNGGLFAGTTEPKAADLWSAGASEARPRFGRAWDLEWRARYSKAPSPLCSAGALHMVVLARCARLSN